MMFMSVLLPDPDGPTIARNSPCSTRRSASRSAGTVEPAHVVDPAGRPDLDDRDRPAGDLATAAPRRDRGLPRSRGGHLATAAPGDEATAATAVEAAATEQPTAAGGRRARCATWRSR